MDSIRTYHLQNPYQSLGDHPAVNIVIGKNGSEVELSTPYEQQKLASQRPRGTRLDSSGTRIQVRGARNYTSHGLYISREEMFDDVVSRGLRADGLSSKLGVKNNKDGICKMIMELFEGDPRLPTVEEHFRTQRQKSNSAKNMFSTMLHEELQFLKQETFPSRIDFQIRDYLLNAFSDHPEKLQATVEVLKQIQHVFKAVTPHADFLSNHNFQTRGFFLDIILMTCSFLMQIIQDSDQGEPTPGQHQQSHEAFDDQPFSSEEKNLKENKRAAEILLSVGSDIVEKSKRPSAAASKYDKIDKFPKPKPTTIVVESADEECKTSEEWTTVEMVDASGNAKYYLIKADNAPQPMDSARIMNILQNNPVRWDDKVATSSNSASTSFASEATTPKRHPASDTILEQVLRDSTGHNLDVDINIPVDDKQNDSTSQRDRILVSSTNFTSNQTSSSNPSVIVDQNDVRQQENPDDVIVNIGLDLSKPAMDNKRTALDQFSEAPKKLRTDGMEPT